MRQTYVFRKNDASGTFKAVPIREARPLPDDGGYHYVVDDTMSALEHPADGRVYDSKSAFRRVTKEYGLEEKGNDRIPPRKPEKDPALHEAVMKSLYQHGVYKY